MIFTVKTAFGKIAYTGIEQREVELSKENAFAIANGKGIKLGESKWGADSYFASLSKREAELVFNSAVFKENNPHNQTLMGVLATRFGIDTVIDYGKKYRVVLSATPCVSVFGRGAGSWTVSPSNDEPFDKVINCFEKGDSVSDWYKVYDVIKDVIEL